MNHFKYYLSNGYQIDSLLLEKLTQNHFIVAIFDVPFIFGV
jgi:hypothetical protein